MGLRRKGMTERQKNVFINSQDQIDKSINNMEFYYKKAKKSSTIVEEMYWWTRVFHHKTRNCRFKRDLPFFLVSELLGQQKDHVYKRNETFLQTSDANLSSEVEYINSLSDKGKKILVNERDEYSLEEGGEKCIAFNFLIRDILTKCKSPRTKKLLACYIVRLKLDTYIVEKFHDEILLQYIREIYDMKSNKIYDSNKFVGSKWAYQESLNELRTLINESCSPDLGDYYAHDDKVCESSRRLENFSRGNHR